MVATRLDFLDLQLQNHSESLEQLKHQSQSLTRALETVKHNEEKQKEQLEKLQVTTSNVPDIATNMDRSEIAHEGREEKDDYQNTEVEDSMFTYMKTKNEEHDTLDLVIVTGASSNHYIILYSQTSFQVLSQWS